jgi:hypothetical protein
MLLVAPGTEKASVKSSHYYGPWFALKWHGRLAHALISKTKMRMGGTPMPLIIPQP